MKQIELVKKISTKTLVGKITRDLIPAKGTLYLFRIIGNAVGTKIGESTYGGFIGFRGNFKATVIADGTEVRSAVAYLPAMATDLLLAAVEGNEANGGVQFAFDVGIKAGDTPTGYEYVVTPLVEAKDSLDQLENTLAKLPPPKPVVAKGGKKGGDDTE